MSSVDVIDASYQNIGRFGGLTELLRPLRIPRRPPPLLECVQKASAFRAATSAQSYQRNSCQWWLRGVCGCHRQPIDRPVLGIEPPCASLPRASPGWRE